MKARKYVLAILVVATLVAIALITRTGREAPLSGLAPKDSASPNPSSPRLYWFIPDGLRAEPDLFRIFEWARQGRLPNVKRMMDGGAWGYSIPVFPGHTPTNFATLLTGTTPRTHGVADGPMRLEQYPLRIVSKSGFSSQAKKVPPIWFTLENQGDRVALLSVPGSTPPELSRGITIKGRWGGWGIEFPAVNFHTAEDTEVRKAQGLDNRLFAQGVALTSYVEAQAPSGWAGVPKSYSEPREVELSNWGESWFALILDSSDDGVENYDRILVSADRIVPLADLRQGEWSGWLPITLRYEVANDYNLYTPKKSSWEQRLSAIEVETRVRIKPILLGRRDFFRIRFHYDDLNRFLAKPAGIADAMTAEIGPMVDFADNFPPQLVYYPEDKATFLEEARMSMEWHREAARYLATRTGADVVIHDIYTPNQFLTSRWWMRYLDPASVRYGEIGESQRKVLWEETFEIYEGIDRILGSILDNVGDDAYVVLSSDHGAIPLDTEVRLNNLFAREGLLRYSIDPETGYHAIDWDNTRVVFLKMDNVYINPDGLAGNYVRGSGDEYEVLRKRVIALLENLEDEDGRRPLAAAVRWEDAEFLDLPKDRVGDLIIANAPGFNWTENVGRDMEVFAPALASGYKQAVNPARSNGLWTPFIVYGPGVRRNHEMAKPIRHIDQYPTIMRLIGRPVPSFVEGTVIEEVLEPE